MVEQLPFSLYVDSRISSSGVQEATTYLCLRLNASYTHVIHHSGVKDGSLAATLDLLVDEGAILHEYRLSSLFNVTGLYGGKRKEKSTFLRWSSLNACLLGVHHLLHSFVTVHNKKTRYVDLLPKDFNLSI